MRVIDDFLPEPDALCGFLHSNDMPWFFEENISGYADVGFSAPVQYGFFHLFYYQGNRSYASDIVEPLIVRANQELGVGWDLYRCRAGLSTKTGSGGVAHPHIDYDNAHQVVLWYADDADGDTVLYSGTPETGLEVAERVSPKRNRALIFDGLTFHSSSYPEQVNARVAVNMNFFARN